MARSSAGRPGPEPDDRYDDGSSDARPPWTTGWQRLSQTFLRPSRPVAPPAPAPGEPVDYSRMTDEEKRRRIVTLDPLERKIGLAAAAFAAVLAIVETVPYMVSKVAVTAPTVTPLHKHCPAGFTYITHGSAAATCRGVLPTGHYALYLGVYLALAAAIYVTVRIRRRSAVAFTTAITGVAFGTFLVLVPYVLVAAWIFLRSWRTQKYGAPNVKTPLPGYVPPRSRGGASRRPKAGGKGGDTATTAATRKPPEASKRYTPKTPPKPAKKSAR